MSKEHAMTVLGLGRKKGSKTPRKLEEYTEEDLLEAFRAESSSLGINMNTGNNNLGNNRYTGNNSLGKNRYTGNSSLGINRYTGNSSLGNNRYKGTVV